MIYTFGEHELDTRLFEVRRGTTRVPVEPQVFDVLSLLVEARDRVVTKEEILERVWADRFISESTLASRLAAARKAIDDDAKQQRLIQTVHGRGYRFVGAVKERAGNGDSEGDRNAPERVSPGPTTPPPSILGRGAELAGLLHALDDAAGGTRQVVFVTGEAGLGKTTLVEAFVARVQASGGPFVTSGQCLEHSGAGEAYMPVLEALGRLCRQPGAGALIDLLVRRAPTWMAQMPWVLSDDQLEALRRRTETSREERMLREMGEALEVLTADRPLVMVLEDLHWSDPSTVDLVAWIAGRAEPCRLLLVGTYRPEEVATNRLVAVHQRLKLRGQCADLALPMLDEDAVREYLEERLPGGPLAERLAPWVSRRTDGNPLFMVNLVEAWTAEGLLFEDGGGWTVRGEIEGLVRRVPETLRQVIELRLAEMPAKARTMLECASVVGKTFSAAAVAAGCGGEAEEVEQCLSRLADEGRFLYPRGTAEWPDGTVAARFEFIHSLYQDVIYERLPAGHRARLHRRIGRRIEQAHGERAAERATELALHFTRGREPRRAVEFLYLAAERALDRSAYREAVGHFEQALEHLAGLPDAEASRLELELLVVYAPTLAAIRGKADPAVGAAFRRANELCQKLDDRDRLFPVLYGLASMHEVCGEFEACQQVLARRDPHPDWPPVEFHELMACSIFHQGDFDQTLDHAERALEAYAGGVPDPYTRVYGESAAVRAHVWMALALWFKGEPDLAVERMQRGLELAEGQDLIYSLSNARAQFACLYQLRREGEPALRWARDTIDVATRHDFAYRLAMGKMIEGWALATDGEHERGIAGIRQGLDLARNMGIELDLPYMQALLVEGYLAAGRVGDGLATVAEALERVESSRRYFYEPELHRLRGLLLLADASTRDARSAEASLERALATAREQGSKSLELRAAISLGRLWSESGRASEATALLGKIVAGFPEGVETVDLQEARQLIR